MNATRNEIEFLKTQIGNVAGALHEAVNRSTKDLFQVWPGRNSQYIRRVLTSHGFVNVLGDDFRDLYARLYNGIRLNHQAVAFNLTS